MYITLNVNKPCFTVKALLTLPIQPLLTLPVQTLNITCEDTVNIASSSDEVVHDVLGVRRLATPTPTQQHQGLVLPVVDHVPVQHLAHGEDVWGHILLLAAFQHLNDLKQQI